MSIDCTHGRCRHKYQCDMTVEEVKAMMDAITPQLSKLIELNGLDTVLAAIREICYAKASQIAVEYQDLAQAKLWLAKGIKVNSAAQGSQPPHTKYYPHDEHLTHPL